MDSINLMFCSCSVIGRIWALAPPGGGPRRGPAHAAVKTTMAIAHPTLRSTGFMNDRPFPASFILARPR
jgi:hypothetical protein